MLAIYIYYFYDERIRWVSIYRKIWRRTHVYARTQLYVHADPEWQLTRLICDVQIKYCNVNFWKHILYMICYYMCWFFKVTMILSLIKLGRITYIQALYVYACTYSADYNEYVLCLFIFLWSKEKIMQYQSSLRCFQSFKWCLLKRSFEFNENLAWSAPMLNDVIESLYLFVKNKYNRWHLPSFLLNYIS